MLTEELLKTKFKTFKSRMIDVKEPKDVNSGLLLEKLLECSASDFNIPDFYDIEIKSIRPYFYKAIALFSCHGSGNNEFQMKYISDTFGVPDNDYSNMKGIRGTIKVGQYKRIGNYYYNLSIDKRAQKLILNIYSLSFKLMDHNTYWDFDDLKEMLERKLRKMALFFVERYRYDGRLHYKYMYYILYYLKDFDAFLNCLKDGDIFVTINTGVRKSGYLCGSFVDHGTAFKINIDSLEKLFDKIETV